MGPKKHRQVGSGGREIVGNGDDWVAETLNPTVSAVGSFPAVTDVTSETGYPNSGYTLQLNTNMSSSSPACGGYGYQTCKVWEQFIYSTDYSGGNAQVFIQNWLFIPTGTSCPSGWTTYDTSAYNGCYKNSGAEDVPSVSATQLASLKLSGYVVTNGYDTATFTDGTTAYAVSEANSTLDISYVWNESEFNVVGNGGGSQAQFNVGASVTVELRVSDGSTTAPACAADAGTTGEINNMILSASCSAYGGTYPYIEFSESASLGTPTFTSETIVSSTFAQEKWQLDWTSVANATYYQVWLGGVDFTPPYYLEVSTSATDGDVTIGRGGFGTYAVQACNASGCGAYSSPVSLSYPLH